MPRPLVSLPRRPARGTAQTLLAAALAGWSAPAFAQPAGVPEFDIEIPAAPGNFGISHVAGIITFTEAPGSADITITNEHGVACAFSVSEGDSPDFHFFDPNSAGCSGGSAQSVNDTATFTAPVGGLPAGDPQRFRYRLDLYPNSNIDFSTPGSCPDASGGTDTWTIEIDSPDLTAASVCLISFDRSVPGAECAAAEQEIASSDPTAVASVVINGVPTTALCGLQRPAADVMLVLDRSGSMNLRTLGSASRPRFAALRSAVSDFVGEWNALRALEGATGDQRSDNLGLVFFDTTAASPVTVPLADFVTSNSTVLSATAAECGGGTSSDPNFSACSGLTSIGGGLESAVSQLFSAGSGENRKVVMLMSDGKQNRAKRVTVDDTDNPTQVLLYDSDPSDTTPLFGEGQDGTIYSVTVGTATAVSADLNEDIARATGGYYVNTEDDQEYLRPFFLEVLQNVLRFNSWQTMLLASNTVATEAPVLVPFPVSTTTRAMTVNLLWEASHGGLSATLLPPGYSEEQALHPDSSENGALRFSLSLPLDDPAVTPEQDWLLRIRAEGAQGDVSAPLRREIPFHVTVSGEDAGLRSSLNVEQANYRPGDDILITARIDNTAPLTDLGLDARIEARILQPGEPIGNVIAASPLAGDPSQDDPGSAADAKLTAILTEDPGALEIQSGTVTLVDDGTGGDVTAGDGIFSGTLSAEAPGHYTVLINVTGQSERSGRFSRAARRSIHVRATPDTVATDDPVVSRVEGGSEVLLGFTPLTAFGHFMPGFAPHFPVTASGIDPVVPHDNLDGSYTARLWFPGALPDDIAINWIESSADLFGLPERNLPVSGPGSQVLVTGFDIRTPWQIPWIYIVPILLLLLLLLVIRRLMSS